MEALTFTQITTDELKRAIREELETFFASVDLRPDPPDEIGGVELAIRITGLSKATIYSLACTRKIPHSKRGKRLYFSRNELIEWLTSGRRKTQTELMNEAQDRVEMNKGSDGTTRLRGNEHVRGNRGAAGTK